MKRAGFAIARRILPRRRRSSGGFVLLEVIVSLIILGISIATLMRSFTISMTAIHKNDITTTACVLAESLLQQAEVTPPTQHVTQGTFEDQGYPSYSWRLSYEDEDIKYKHLKATSKVKDMKPLHHVTLTVTYADQKMRTFNPIEVELYLPPIERFSYNSKFWNELFKNDAQR